MDGFQEGSTPNSYDKSLEAQEGCHAGFAPILIANVDLSVCSHSLATAQLLIIQISVTRRSIVFNINNSSCDRNVPFLSYASSVFQFLVQLSGFKHLWDWPGKTGRSPKGPRVGEMPLTMQSNRKLICSLSADASRKTPAPAESRLC